MLLIAKSEVHKGSEARKTARKRIGRSSCQF
jgi:hypothetical protein